MSGIYLHIPFCRRKCHYCNFYSIASLKYKDRFLETLKEEIFLRKNYLDGKPLESVYLGGGTPSILQIQEIQGILEELRKYFLLDKNCEITLEANPDADDFYPVPLAELPLQLNITPQTVIVLTTRGSNVVATAAS